MRFVAVLLRHKLLISSAVVVAAGGAGLYAALRPDVYEASVLLIPESQTLPDPHSQLKRAAGELFSGSPVLSEGENVCLDLLDSNRLLDAVIDGLPELSRAWGGMHREDMRKTLLLCSTFEPTRSALRITVRVTDSQLSAHLANAFATELQRLYRSVVLDRLRREAEFLRKRLAEAGRELAEAEDTLAEFQRTRKMLRPEESATATFSALISLEARVIEEEARLQVLKSYASAQNPEVRLQEERVKALRKSMAGIEQDGDQPGASYIPDEVLIPLERLPEVGLEGVRIEREVRLREKLYLFLMECYETVKLAEAKGASALTVIERAEAPEVRSGPRRKVWVALAALSSTRMTVVGTPWSANSCARSARRKRGARRSKS